MTQPAGETITQLDRALHDAFGDATAGPVLDALFNTELFVLLDKDPEGDAELSPRVLELETGPALLAFDLPERLAAAAGAGADYAAMPGRALLSMLDGQGMALAINIGIEGGEMFLDPTQIGWSVAFLAEAGAEESSDRLAGLSAPVGAPPALVSALNVKLSALAPMLEEAWLMQANAADGEKRLVLMLHLVKGCQEQEGIARSLTETVRLVMPDEAVLDLAFAEAAGDPVLVAARNCGMGFDLPEPPAAPEGPEAHSTGPGMDPDKPPRLI